jgi:putative methyltransferase (TIGR04325 family)
VVARDALRGAALRAGRWPVVGGAVARAYRRYFDAASGKHTRLFHGLYADFATAEAAIPAARACGYDNAASAERVLAEWLDVYPSDFPVIVWLAKLLPACELLFDWGGNVGLKYFAFAKYLDYPAEFTWLVNDVPAVVELGRATARREGASGLRFTTSLEELPRADVLLAAGALHFIDDPLGKLRALSRLPAHLLLSKVPALEAPSAWSVHNMGTALCPYRLFNRDELVAEIEGLGYALVDEWRIPDVTCEIPFHPDYAIDAYSGFYFTRR